MLLPIHGAAEAGAAEAEFQQRRHMNVTMLLHCKLNMISGNRNEPDTQMHTKQARSKRLLLFAASGQNSRPDFLGEFRMNMQTQPVRERLVRRIASNLQFSTGFMHLVCALALTIPALADEPAKPDSVPAAEPAVEFTVKGEANTDKNEPVIVTGRIMVEAQDGGVLLEARSGRIQRLTPGMIVSRKATESAFTPLPPDELATELLSQVPAGFEIHQTEHYVFCSNSSQEYVEFCGKLLEKVFDEYFKFMADQEIVVRMPAAKLPIIILQSESDFKAFAARQHPETSFENTPGYYSIRENQTLLMDLTRDRSIRSASAIRKRLAEQPLQVGTMVHEAVHQLAFNTGLQVRLADNPVWFSEGLALYFEQIVPRSGTLWTKPGLVNARHHPEFVRRTETGAAQIRFGDLMRSDATFMDASTVAVAYAESWAMMTYLFRQEKAGMKLYLTNLSQRKPLQSVTPEQRIQEFTAAFGKSPDEMERDVISYIRRLRVSK